MAKSYHRLPLPTMIKRTTLVGLLAGAALLAGCGSSSSSSSSTSASASSSGASASSTRTSAAQVGFEGVSIEQGQDVAPAGSTGTGTVDGIRCGASEQLAYHIHARLTVFAAGQSRALPGGIGIPGSTVQPTAQGPVAAGGRCIYWLHTHAPDGIIHVESPTHRVYTLGTFFDEWHQPLTSSQVGTLSGQVSAVVDGKSWPGSPRAVPLNPHAVIQLDVGSPAAPFRSLSWSGLGL